MTYGQTITPSEVFLNSDIQLDKAEARNGWIAVIDGTIFGLRRDRLYPGNDALYTVAELEGDETTIAHKLGSFHGPRVPTKKFVRNLYDTRHAVMVAGVEATA